MFLKIKDLKYISGYILELTFNDGVTKTVDLSHELNGRIFEPLKNISFFKTVKISDELGTITWSNSADFSPEYLYEIGSR